MERRSHPGSSVIGASRRGWMTPGTLRQRTWSYVAALVLAAGTARSEGGDDQYRFDPDRSQETDIVLRSVPDGVDFTWALPSQRVWDTAFLAVHVRKAGPDSWVDVSAEGTRIAQYLDPQAHGLRWLNLTSLAPALRNGARVVVRTHGAMVDAGTARLRFFRTAFEPHRTILIVAPHPDDAEIAAFGLYSTHARDSFVLTVTSGDAGSADYAELFGGDTAAQYAFKGYLRSVDSVTIPWQGGVPPERCYNLGYFDGRLADMFAHPQDAIPEMYAPNQDIAVFRRANVKNLLPLVPRENSWVHLVEDLESVLRKVHPAAIVVPHPLLDAHSDHGFVTAALSAAVAHSKYIATFLLYTNHAAEDLYPYGPAGTVMSLPPWSGPEISAQRVFSVPLGAELQRRKLFALEAHHDLRSAAALNAGSKHGAQPRDCIEDAIDWYRRAVRSEETFLVVDNGGLRDVVQTYLQSKRP